VHQAGALKGQLFTRVLALQQIGGGEDAGAENGYGSEARENIG